MTRSVRWWVGGLVGQLVGWLVGRSIIFCGKLHFHAPVGSLVYASIQAYKTLIITTYETIKRNEWERGWLWICKNRKIIIIITKISSVHFSVL